MGKNVLFRELLSFYKELTTEEELVLCIHSILLESGLENTWKEPNSNYLSKGDEMTLSEKYMQYGRKTSRDDFFVGKILINPNWRKNDKNYTFNYKNEIDGRYYNLYVLHVNKSIIVQLVNTEDAASLQSVTIDSGAYIIKDTAENSEINWTTINVSKLQDTLNEALLNKFGLNKKNSNENGMESKLKNDININLKCNSEACKTKQNTLNNEFENNERVTRTSYHFINDDRFDDKQPALLNSGMDICNQLRKSFILKPHGLLPDTLPRQDQTPDGSLLNQFSPDMLKPDGLFFGPNQKLFGPSNIRYDPMGPYGFEPNFD